MESKTIEKITYHEFPKHPDSYVIWKYKLIHYTDGEVRLSGLWF